MNRADLVFTPEEMRRLNAARVAIDYKMPFTEIIHLFVMSGVEEVEAIDSAGPGGLRANLLKFYAQG